MTRYAKKKLKYSRNENWSTSGMRVTLSYLGADNRKVTYYENMEFDLCG